MNKDNLKGEHLIALAGIGLAALVIILFTILQFKETSVKATNEIEVSAKK
ncbi:MAG: hypothetical protein U0U09_14290 [Cyclobacteriaceae bacterium]